MWTFTGACSVMNMLCEAFLSWSSMLTTEVSKRNLPLNFNDTWYYWTTSFNRIRLLTWWSCWKYYIFNFSVPGGWDLLGGGHFLDGLEKYFITSSNWLSVPLCICSRHSTVVVTALRKPHATNYKQHELNSKSSVLFHLVFPYLYTIWFSLGTRPI